MQNINDRIPDFLCNIIDNKKVLRKSVAVKFVPRVGEVIHLIDGEYKVTEIIHMLCPHDINIKVKKTKEKPKD